MGAEWVVLALGICLVGIVALVFGALWMYRDAQTRRRDATVWVVLLVVATLLAGIIGFVIVLVIFLVVRENHPIGGGVPMGYGPYAPDPAPGAPAAPPRCGPPMTWFPPYPRWYCPSFRAHPWGPV